MKIGNFDSFLQGEDFTENTEIISINTGEDRLTLQEPLPEVLSILPLKNTVLFPGVVLPITIRREASMQLIKEAMDTKYIGTISQKNDIENPQKEDIYRVGTVARILKTLKIPDGSLTIFVQGTRRFQVEEFVEEQPYFKARVREITEIRPSEEDEQ